jgi:hypothetical protein
MSSWYRVVLKYTCNIGGRIVVEEESSLKICNIRIFEGRIIPGKCHENILIKELEISKN